MDVEIDGYCDITGGDIINNRLSKQRAVAVKKFLMERGVPEKRIITTGHGSKHPIDTNKTKEGRAKNRRASIKLKYSTVFNDNTDN